MSGHKLSIIALPDLFAVCRLEADAPAPAWALAAKFFSMTRSTEELSIVCPQNLVPVGVRCEGNWRCLRIAGAMDFSMIGVVASLVNPMVDAGISVFVVSTFDTDYLLVKAIDLDQATAALRAAGHEVR